MKLCTSLIFLTVAAVVLAGGCLSAGPASPAAVETPAGTGPETTSAAPENTPDIVSPPAETPSAASLSKTVILAETRDGQELYYPLGHSRCFGTGPSEPNNTIAVFRGETIRFWNGDTKMNSKMLFHSVEGRFDDYIIHPRYSCYMTFPDIGKYQISLLNGERYLETGILEPYPGGESILTIYVVEEEPETTV